MQEHRPLRGPWWLIAPVTLFALLLFIMLACHECLAFAMAVVCERSNNAMDVQMESNRAHGYIKECQFAGCLLLARGQYGWKLAWLGAIRLDIQRAGVLRGLGPFSCPYLP